MGSVARAWVKTKPKEQTLHASRPQTRRLHVNNAIQIQKIARVWPSVRAPLQHSWGGWLHRQDHKTLTTDDCFQTFKF